MTRVGGVPEVCRDSETGLIVDAGDSGALARAIIRLAKDRALREIMGRAGSPFVRDHYVWRDNVNQMMGYLERLCHKHNHTKKDVAMRPAQSNTTNLRYGLLRALEAFMLRCRVNRVLNVFIRRPIQFFWYGGWNWFFAMRIWIRGPICELRVHGRRLFVDLRDKGIARRLFWSKIYELEETQLVKTLLSDGILSWMSGPTSDTTPSYLVRSWERTVVFLLLSPLPTTFAH